MRLLDRIRDWLHRRRAAHRLEREARRRLAEIFANPALLRGTSLRPEHRSRVMVTRVEADGERLTRIFFSIIRHPRPYAFSRQVHEVLEVWQLDLPEMKVRRADALNLSRLRRTDGEPSTHGPGI